MTTDELMALADEWVEQSLRRYRGLTHDEEAARTALRSALEAAVGEMEPLTEEQQHAEFEAHFGVIGHDTVRSLNGYLDRSTHTLWMGWNAAVRVSSKQTKGAV